MPKKDHAARPWYARVDFLCVCAVILGLVGAIPHLLDGLTGLVRAWKSEAQAYEREDKSGNGEIEAYVVHPLIMHTNGAL